MITVFFFPKFVYDKYICTLFVYSHGGPDPSFRNLSPPSAPAVPKQAFQTTQKSDVFDQSLYSNLSGPPGGLPHNRGTHVHYGPHAAAAAAAAAVYAAAAVPSQSHEPVNHSEGIAAAMLKGKVPPPPAFHPLQMMAAQKPPNGGAGGFVLPPGPTHNHPYRQGLMMNQQPPHSTQVQPLAYHICNLMTF